MKPFREEWLKFTKNNYVKNFDIKTKPLFCAFMEERGIYFSAEFETEKKFKPSLLSFDIEMIRIDNMQVKNIIAAVLYDDCEVYNESDNDTDSKTLVAKIYKK